MAIFICPHGSSQRVIIHVSAAPGFNLTKLVTRPESSGSALHLNQKLIMNCSLMAAAAVRIQVSRLSKSLRYYVMTYTALSPQGPRIALAISEDLLHWERLGLVTFEPYEGIEFNGIDNKDARIFPVAVPDSSEKLALALLHRPLFLGTRPEEKARKPESAAMDIHRESIWFSYRDIDIKGREPYHLCHFTSHHRLATPVSPWEQLKIGGGTPPVLTQHGWLIVYHGVSKMPQRVNEEPQLCYSAGVMVLAKEHPREIFYRSTESVLTPELPQEHDGIVPNVVFPTGIDQRNDLGKPNRFDIYYGMADDRIGAARLDLPDFLPPEGSADPTKES